MPWQQTGGRLLSQLTSEVCQCHSPALRLPRFKTVIATVPRQQGKTVLSRSSVVTKAEAQDFSEIYGTAQSRQYAAKHVIKLGQVLKRADPRVVVTQGVGNERVVWPNGSTYMPISPTEGGGHGDSIDFMLIDEGWALEMATLGGVRPAMIARPHSQLLVISTMGTSDSVVWNGMVARGREAVEDPNSDTAYIEYSAPTDEAVFEDDCTDDSRIGTPECVWGQWMPALGITVTHAGIRSAIEDMMSDPAQGMSEVVRAFGNRTVKTLVTLFPGTWIEAAWRVVKPPERFVLAVDVNDEPMGATITQGFIGPDPDDESKQKIVTRVVDWRFGSPRWVPDVVQKIVQSRQVEAVVVDPGGPARAILHELKTICETELVPLEERKPRDIGADFARFYDDLREGNAVLGKSEALAESIAGAVKKEGDNGLSYIHRRRMTVDASPLISSIMAHGLAVELAVNPVQEFFIW